MSEVIKPWDAHVNLRKALGDAAAGDVFLEMARSYEPDHTLSARGVVRAIKDVAYELDIYPQAMLLEIPAGADLKTAEPYVRGLLGSLQQTASFYDTPAYKELNDSATPRRYYAAIESAWTKVHPQPSV